MTFSLNFLVIEMDKEIMEMQEEFEKLVKETGDKLLKMTRVDMVDGILVDFIGNLIDYCLSVKATTMIYGLYATGQMDKKEMYNLIDKLNLRPRYKKMVVKVVDEMINEEEKEVM